MFNAGGPGNERITGKTNKQTVLHYPRNRGQSIRQCLGSRNPAQGGIEDEVARIRDQSMTVRTQA